jgi:arginyl-tRNA synthetase
VVTPEQLSSTIAASLTALADAGALTLPDGPPAAVRVERSRQREHGDYSTNVALQLAKRAGLPPREFARLVADELSHAAGIADVEIAGPGFINITVDAAAQGVLASEVVAADEAYGRSSQLAGKQINLEFVSANPTGPVLLSHARWAAVGDSLARIFTACGAEVTREYYFNDHGRQIDQFSRSLLAAAQGKPIPDDGYAGSYIDEIAAAVMADEPGVLELPDPDAQEVFRRVGVDMMFTQIKQQLREFGVDFDVYFHENSLHESGAVERAIDRLKGLDLMYEADGAWWLKSSQFGDDKDRVVIKSDGTPAYISGDLAYYLDKRERGYELLVIVLGADHHGYVARMMAMCQAFGDKPHENLEIIIGQMVNLVHNGEPVRLSKRAGTVLTIEDLVDAVGVDAARYALVRFSPDSNIDIDLELWAKQSSDNPVYYVQYAHARLASILRNAAELGLALDGTDFDVSLLSHEREGGLLRALAEFPRVVQSAADLREPHRVARYLEDTASVFHKFYDVCRVLPQGDEEATDLHRARLMLVRATMIVIRNGLRLLGVSTPDRM